MPESVRLWMEIPFNVAYLGVIWTLVVVMWQRQGRVPTRDQPISLLFLGAFASLAIGDSGHLGFRLWAYALGDVEASVRLFGSEFGLIGLGALATATTVTLFYMCLQMIWQRRFRKAYGWFGMLLFGM